VVITSLAAQAAGSTNGADIASEINGITQGGDKCTTFADCKAIIDGGGDPDYDGVTGTLDFTDAGEPGSGSYGILTFTAENTIAENPEFVVVGASG